MSRTRQFSALDSVIVSNIMVNRRDFILKSGQICAGACGLSVWMSMLSACKTTTPAAAIIEEDKIILPLSSFGKKKVVILSDKKFPFDIAVVKKNESQYRAFEMQCTHQMNAVRFTGDGFFCPSHGSTFDLEGNVTGFPAIRPLKQFSSEITNEQLIIRLS